MLLYVSFRRKLHTAIAQNRNKNTNTVMWTTDQIKHIHNMRGEGVETFRNCQVLRVDRSRNSKNGSNWIHLSFSFCLWGSQRVQVDTTYHNHTEVGFDIANTSHLQYTQTNFERKTSEKGVNMSSNIWTSWQCRFFGFIITQFPFNNLSQRLVFGSFLRWWENKEKGYAAHLDIIIIFCFRSTIMARWIRFFLVP